MRESRREPDRLSIAGSIGVHAVAVLVAWATTAAKPAPMEFVTYQIELVSPPPAAASEKPQEARKELVVERPEPEPPAPEEPTPAPVPKKKKKKLPPPKKETTAEPPPEEAVKKAEAKSPDARPDSKRESGEDINVRMEGVRKDYPAYYNNIIRQMRRCFRWQGRGRWAATVYFVIRHDGSVGDLDVVKSSGNPSFDLQALGAAECAGKGRLGPLPPDLPFDRLPILFRFQPNGGPGDIILQEMNTRS